MFVPFFFFWWNSPMCCNSTMLIISILSKTATLFFRIRYLRRTKSFATFVLMEIAILILAVVLTCYVALISCFWWGFHKVRRQPGSASEAMPVSVVVPFRNESANIARTIKSLLNQDFDCQFEVVAVDDNSTDNSWLLLAEMAEGDNRLQLVKSESEGKKGAIATGIKAARYNQIALTDADCLYPALWLKTMVQEFAGSWLLCAPVKITDNGKWFGWFQYADFASLVGCGIGAAGCGHPIMCNGANIMFSKNIVSQIDNPFRTEVQSGDDVFLLHAIKRLNPQKIKFTCHPDTIAETSAVNGFGAFLRQRLRWGGKTPSYTDADSIATAAIVAATSLCVAVCLALMPWLWLPLAIAFGTKTVVDALLLNTVCKTFGNRRLLWQMPAFEAIVVLYTNIVVLATVIGIKRRWK